MPKKKQPLIAPDNGRRPDAYKARFFRVLEQSNAVERLTRMLKSTKNDEIFLKALNLVLDRALGKAVQRADVNIEETKRFIVLLGDEEEKKPVIPVVLNEDEPKNREITHERPN